MGTAPRNRGISFLKSIKVLCEETSVSMGLIL